MGGAKLTSRFLGVAACAALATGAAACSDDPAPADVDLIAGKKAFVAKCGACHELSRAGTKGTQGPNLDAAFSESLSEGFGRTTVRGAVHHQILYPARLEPGNPALMPAKLVSGKVADDVASYVASVVALPGKDEGLLGSAVQAAGAGKPVAATGGKLLMPADPSGQLAYVTKKATAPAGRLEVDSKNPSSTPHDIALEGNGVHAQGKVVQGGGVSTFTVTLKPGTYQYYCTVQGHRAGGMEGTLTVK